MNLIVLCWVLHFPASHFADRQPRIETECHVTTAPSAHDAATAFVRSTPETTREWDVVWHTVSGNLAVIHYQLEEDLEDLDD